MASRLLVVGAGRLQVPAIELGRKLGLEVIATDRNPKAPGASLAHRFFPVSTIDVEATIRVAQDCGVQGVLTLGTDFPVRTVAEVARRLGLPGISPETARAATDKHLMCVRFQEHGVPCPRFHLAASLEEAAAAAEEFGYPVILKPTDRSGSAGVSSVASAVEVPAAFAAAHRESRIGQVLVEEFIGGREISVETMAHDGEFGVVAITDKLTTGPPHFVEMGHCVPCELEPEMAEVVCDTARRASRALGVDSGPTHTEMKLADRRATIIEVGARLGGDWITSHLVPLATGVSLVEASIRIALGEKPNLEPTRHRAAAIRYFAAPPGRVTAIAGLEAAGAMPGVTHVGIEIEVGGRLPPIRSSGDRLGWLIAVGADPKEAVVRAETARDSVAITTVPEAAP